RQADRAHAGGGAGPPAGGGRPGAPRPRAPAPAPFRANPRCPPPPTPPAPPTAGGTFTPAPYLHFTNQTLRQILHVSIGGSKARVVLSNAYGTAPVTIGAAHIALRDKLGSIQAGSGRPLMSTGQP